MVLKWFYLLILSPLQGLFFNKTVFYIYKGGQTLGRNPKMGVGARVQSSRSAGEMPEERWTRRATAAMKTSAVPKISTCCLARVMAV